MLGLQWFGESAPPIVNIADRALGSIVIVHSCLGQGCKFLPSYQKLIPCRRSGGGLRIFL